MNSAHPLTEAGSAPAVEGLRALMVTATQRLLGDTIKVTDEEWRGASRLPGWTRGHVATHLARQADAVVRLIDGARAGSPQQMYGSPGQRETEIEAGAHRSGLELQIDLDTSAGALSEAFESVAQDAAWEAVVELRGGDQAPVRLLPLARLAEVVLHHVDLDIGMQLADVDQATADRLLDWLTFRTAGRQDFPRLRVRSTSGSWEVGGRSSADREPPEVTGESAALLGWLTGRGDRSTLDGAGEVELPAF
jgi:maleylpyruvate isomerase